MKLSDGDYQRILENLHDGLYIVDRNRVITYWNKGAEQISGFMASEVVGKSCADDILTHVDDKGNNLCSGVCPLAASMSDGKGRKALIYMHHKDGHRIPVAVRVSTVKDSDGKVIGGVELFTDISHQAANQLRVQELEKLALLDNLTQLANRNYMEKEILSKFEEHKRFGTRFGCLFMDADYFKSVNDEHGHAVGDAVLQSMARTFVANARPFDLYGRWGGEEFIGIVRCEGVEDLASLGERLRMLVESSYIVHEDKKISVTISIGATLFAEDDTMESLLKRADALLYKSKNAGRNHTSVG